MKLRMYLRGLGLGMIITAIVLSFSAKPEGKQMSDADIKKKAAELGMVEEDKTLVKPSEALETQQSDQDETQPIVSESAEEKPDESISDEKPEKETEDNNATENKAEENKIKETIVIEPEVSENKNDTVISEDKKEESKTEEPKKEETDIKASEQKEEPKKEEPKKEESKEEEKKPEKKTETTITVAGGSSSDVVAKLLEKNGVVDSASKFDSYLCSNGYDKIICAGTHTIPANADYATIAKIITSR